MFGEVDVITLLNHS